MNETSGPASLFNMVSQSDIEDGSPTSRHLVSIFEKMSLEDNRTAVLNLLADWRYELQEWEPAESTQKDAGVAVSALDVILSVADAFLMRCGVETPPFPDTAKFPQTPEGDVRFTLVAIDTFFVEVNQAGREADDKPTESTNTHRPITHVVNPLKLGIPVEGSPINLPRYAMLSRLQHDYENIDETLSYTEKGEALPCGHAYVQEANSAIFFIDAAMASTREYIEKYCSAIPAEKVDVWIDSLLDLEDEFDALHDDNQDEQAVLDLQWCASANRVMHGIFREIVASDPAASLSERMLAEPAKYSGLDEAAIFIATMRERAEMIDACLRAGLEPSEFGRNTIVEATAVAGHAFASIVDSSGGNGSNALSTIKTKIVEENPEYQTPTDEHLMRFTSAALKAMVAHLNQNHAMSN